ncbi:hypothetical protein GLOTRDRAFT_130451 [Gloeophyllum trabeum ATCC 11539]|uniref:Uncharacterized protein n=1 Tax=Gloeophyllum trabeum (strain ATCC 11539 / FP-39264 / Madison 617) TaxID=670483 RepID=S7Q3D5_GLOTA|nr:uncharacterized protein GLOTRDRAFT_130451 [Gloeophyllum trabeum ATCC 11539]EPQ54067.1 hypothetical protein GLOTRDRAFT_130451 [Gloeophyllum trabeum ATCC 11539]
MEDAKPDETTNIESATEEQVAGGELEETVTKIPVVKSFIDDEDSSGEVPVPTAERPRSPWTPSYSFVKTPELQGESLPAPDDAVTQSPVIVLPMSENAVSDRPKSPWMPSYSVTRSPDLRAEVEPFVDEPIPQTRGLDSLPVAHDEAVPERPKSPWTLSYTVTRQGSGLTPGHELPPLEQLPGPATIADNQQGESLPESAIPSIVTEEVQPQEPVDEEVAEASHVPEVASTPPSSLGMSTLSFESQSEVSETSEAAVAPAYPILQPEAEMAVTEVVGFENDATPLSTPAAIQPEPTDNVALPKTVESNEAPDTVLESNVTGDTFATEILDHLEEVREASAPVGNVDEEPFPSAEDKLTTSHLAPIDEDKSVEQMSSIFLDPDAASRPRHESTTSSRFFPGGWFSSPVVSPQEGRASLDSVQGEFTSGAPTPSAATTEEDKTEKEKKSKWCVIM